MWAIKVSRSMFTYVVPILRCFFITLIRYSCCNYYCSFLSRYLHYSHKHLDQLVYSSSYWVSSCWLVGKLLLWNWLGISCRVVSQCFVHHLFHMWIYIYVYTYTTHKIITNMSYVKLSLLFFFFFSSFSTTVNSFYHNLWVLLFSNSVSHPTGRGEWVNSCLAPSCLMS